MNFDQKLLPGILRRRYQRFFAEVELKSGEQITAHCPNTGSMRGLVEPGLGVYVSQSTNPRRKLAYTLELVNAHTSLVGVHTGRANTLAKEAITAGSIAQLLGYGKVRQEIRYSQNSRIDLLLEDPATQRCCYVEVKSVTLREGPAACFPDAVTTRGAKHLDDLIATVRLPNQRAVMFYLVQREDCQYFTPADDIDPTYGAKLRSAAEQGVEMLAYACQVSPQGIQVTQPLPIQL
ncbi:DNA/RNA nuclease SfsA [Nitrosococcus wardiae]|uniref:Sugar fermentation stimulation protein homolog n=1 Tax=Nitrosococcus wardiae TaxID=1814290 RepID=A0A4P7C106_9GAMM|nr:DNA/RNA nuclease SfsA [Nitrosococcus wardiae]QBQ56278.1 DNA/RNA nuclease SfsA [Nitrosococcus wardiae]